MKRVYIVSSETLNIQQKLVSAKSKASAIKHVVGNAVNVKIADKAEIIKFLGTGMTVEESAE